MLPLDAQVNRPMARAISGLVRAGDLEPRSVEGLFALDLDTERYPPGAAIGPMIDAPSVAAVGGAPSMKWLLEGWVCEARVLPGGQRQIFSFAIPGDVIELPLSPLSRAVVAVTAVECVDVADLLTRPVVHADDVLDAMARAVALASARRYEHLSRLGRRSAIVRLASLLVELHDRLDLVGMVRAEEFALPLRHEELADALGLTPVHITRCLKTLRQRGLMTMKFRRVTGFRRAELERLCD
jgi:CRP-like cAMP-binding protein